MLRRLIFALAASAALAAGFSASALADGASGPQIASCAQVMLGQRDNPPAVICSCGGTTTTFATFGAMVAQMRP